MSTTKDEALPYPECENCKDLSDCKNVEVALDGLGTPLPPSFCPRPITVLKRSYHKKKRKDGEPI